MPRWSLLVAVAVGCGPISEWKTPETGACAEPSPVDNTWLAGDTWPRPDEVGETGFDVGDTLPNLRQLDQYGDEVCLWQFADRVTVVDISAVDCLPCQAAAAKVVCTANDFGDVDFAYVTILQDWLNGATVEQPDLVTWADYFDLYETNTPVVMDPGSVFSSTLTTNPPAFVVVDRDLTVVGKLIGWGPTSEDELRALVATELGTDPYPNGEGSCD